MTVVAEARPAPVIGEPRRRGRPPARWGRRWTWRADLAAMLLLGLAAAAVRWPYLLRLPHFTDETVETRRALEIWRGEALHLTVTHRSGYAGALHEYIVAACLWLFGPHITLPRLVVLVFGALTVVATYPLGRELAGRGAGLLGAALLLTAPQHIVVNSHVAWQNSTTPLYTTLCGWALLRGLRLWRAEVAAPSPARRGARAGRWLVASGALYGLALQTHIGVIVLLPALLAAFLHGLRAARGWRLLRGPWPYAATAAALAAYSPVIAYNLATGFSGVVRARTSSSYAYEVQPSWGTYTHNLANLLLEVARVISNPMRLPERRLHYLSSPYLLVAVGLCLAGLALLAWRRQPLPLLALLSTAAIMPYFNHAYGVEGDRYLVTGRYIAFLLPPLEVAIAVAALALAARAVRAVPRRWRGLALRQVAVGAAAVLLATLVLYPLLPLGRYYTAEAARDPANASFLETVRVVNAQRGPRTPVWLDSYFAKVDLKDGAEALDILDLLLTLDGVPHQIVDDPVAELRRVGPTLDPADAEGLPLVVMPRDRCWPLRDEAVPVYRVSDTLLLNELYRYYGVYRYGQLPAEGSCQPLPWEAAG